MQIDFNFAHVECYNTEAEISIPKIKYCENAHIKHAHTHTHTILFFQSQ